MQVKSINHKLDAFKHELSTRDAYKIECNIDFIDDVMFNYIFKIFNKSKIINTLKISNMDNIDDTFNKLQQCYKCKIDINLSNLSDNQLRYLINGGI